VTWARFDENFYNHPKLALLDDLMLPCVGLQTLAICYCNHYLTDGFVPTAMVIRLAGDVTKLLPPGTPWMLVNSLIDAGMWEKAKGGYKIHDYLDYNPSRAQVLEERAQRQAAGRAGGQASASARTKQTPSKPSTIEQAKSNPGSGSGSGSKELPVEKHQEIQDSTTMSGSTARLMVIAKRLLDFLNHKTGRNYQPGDANMKLIVGRLRDGATEDQIRAVIGLRTAKWKGDPEMDEYLRPATLFNRTKFAQYVGELPKTAFDKGAP
jgi:uncharacterized phage protein (TIGR02220 family)